MATTVLSREGIKDRVRTRLMEGPMHAELERLSAPERRLRVRAEVMALLKEERAILPSGALTEVVNQVSDEVVGLGPVERLLKDPDVSEVMVNGADDVYVERKGRIERVDDLFFEGEEQVFHLIERIVAPLGLRVDESSPYVDARLADGSRVNAIIPPLSLCGPVVTIRKFTLRPLTPEDLIRVGSLNQPILELLAACVRARANIMVSGGTGSGKTTFLGVLSSFIPEEERLVTIEDAAELRLSQPHVVSLEARPPTVEGNGEVTVRALVRNALRMRPDRIIVGEVRGGEALDMLQAMNTGHEGSLSTAHANSARDLLSRLETMALMSDVDLPLMHIREQISGALDVVVHLARLPDGRRVVADLCSVGHLNQGAVHVDDVFRWRRDDPSGFEFCGIPSGLATLLAERGERLDADSFGSSDARNLASQGSPGRPARKAAVPGGEERSRRAQLRSVHDGWPGSLRRLGAILD